MAASSSDKATQSLNRLQVCNQNINTQVSPLPAHTHCTTALLHGLEDHQINKHEAGSWTDMPLVPRNLRSRRQKPLNCYYFVTYSALRQSSRLDRHALVHYTESDEAPSIINHLLITDLLSTVVHSPESALLSHLVGSQLWRWGRQRSFLLHLHQHKSEERESVPRAVLQALPSIVACSTEYKQRVEHVKEEPLESTACESTQEARPTWYAAGA